MRGFARFHTPGHKGASRYFLGNALRYDLTEIAGMDSLYEASGPIAATEAAFARLYGTAGSLLSAGGSTLCVQAMLAMAARPGEKVICARGVHTAAVNAMALLDVRPVWVFPEADPLTGLSAPVTAAQINAALDEHSDAAAVYLTSPSYYGVLSDVAAIAEVCGRHSVPLLVDNAHGAHLKFLPESLHPADLGADLCCDSLHKTLPVLTGGALLHVINPAFLPSAKRKMSLFGSTSPSYLILLSADAALDYLETDVGDDLARTAEAVAELAELAQEKGLLLPGGACDPVRLAVGFGPVGWTAGDMRTHLAAYGVEPELCAGSWCVFLAGGANRAEDFARLRAAIGDLPVSNGQAEPEPLPFSPPQIAVSLREAVLADSEELPVDEAEGRIAAGSVAPCPPGIPVVVPGEKINEAVLFLLKKYGILSVGVIK